jgi:hypothetical protein
LKVWLSRVNPEVKTGAKGTCFNFRIIGIVRRLDIITAVALLFSQPGLDQVCEVVYLSRMEFNVRMKV